MKHYAIQNKQQNKLTNKKIPNDSHRYYRKSQSQEYVLYESCLYDI